MLQQKEKECLKTDVIAKKIVEMSNSLLVDNRQDKINFWKALGFITRLFASLNPSQIIIKDNLTSPWKEIYESTFEYKRAKTRGVDSIDSLCFNPFDLHERQEILTATQIEKENKIFKRIISARINKITDADEKKMLGLLRGKDIYEQLDRRINNIKVKSLIKVFNKVIEIAIKDESDENKAAAGDAARIKIYTMLTTIKNSSGQTLLSLLTDVFMNRCIRNAGKNLIQLMKRIQYIVGDDLAPYLTFDANSIQNVTIKDIPLDYRECFVVNADDDYYALILGSEIQNILQNVPADPYNNFGGGGKRKKVKKRKQKVKREKQKVKREKQKVKREKQKVKREKQKVKREIQPKKGIAKSVRNNYEKDKIKISDDFLVLFIP